MSEAWVERVVLDLLPGEPISGRISAGDEKPALFHGWVDLASKLEHLRHDNGSRAASPSEVTDEHES
jgi:hypothetical protein